MTIPQPPPGQHWLIVPRVWDADGDGIWIEHPEDCPKEEVTDAAGVVMYTRELCGVAYEEDWKGLSAFFHHVDDDEPANFQYAPEPVRPGVYLVEHRVQPVHWPSGTEYETWLEIIESAPEELRAQAE